MKKEKNNMTVKVLTVLLIATIGFGIFQTIKPRDNMNEELKNQAITAGMIIALNEVVSRSETCEVLTITVEEKNANILNTACLPEEIRSQLNGG